MRQQVSRLKRVPHLKRPRESLWNWRMASKMRLCVHVSWLDLRLHQYSSMLDNMPPRCQLILERRGAFDLSAFQTGCFTPEGEEEIAGQVVNAIQQLRDSGRRISGQDIGTLS